MSTTTPVQTPPAVTGLSPVRDGVRLRQHWAEWVRRQWRNVAIRHVDVGPHEQCDRIGTCVMAYIHLGELTPADVRVKVTRARAQAVERREEPRAVAEPFAPEWPMVASASMRNGEYRFEAHTPLPLGGTMSSLLVRVEPAREIADPRPVPVSCVVGTLVPA